jgi:hypothetical protein
MPELAEMASNIEKDTQNKEKNKFQLWIKLQNIGLQNLGILIGLTLMLLSALYSKNISL